MEATKFLIITDFHTSKVAYEGLDKLLDRKKSIYDGVLLLGDSMNHTDRELPYVEQLISLLKNKHQLPLFGVHGNNETEAAMKLHRDTGINVHLETQQFNDYNICGIGSFGYLNETAFDDLSIENLIINEKTIFLTHVPPRKVESSEKGPLVHLFGHKHVLSFSNKVGPTLQVQCPAGVLGKVTELSLPSLEVQFIEL